MRRGLMAWNEAEISLAALDARAERLRAAMREDGLDGFLIYTNFPRPSAVAWLTSFTPYWSEAILYVPIEGEIVFATALSKRVGQWARSVNPVGEIAHTPRPGVETGRRIAAAGARRIGVLEFDLFPNGVYEDCAKAATAATFVDGSAAFSRARAMIDATERSLIDHADLLARAGLAAVDPESASAGEAVAAAEEKVRLGGAEEVYVAIAPDLDRDRRFIRSIRRRAASDAASRCVYRRLTKGAGCAASRPSRETKRAARPSLRQMPGSTKQLRVSTTASPRLAAQIAEAVASLPDATVTRWSAESCLGSYPLEAIAGEGASIERKTKAGSFVVLEPRSRRCGRALERRRAWPFWASECVVGSRW